MELVIEPEIYAPSIDETGKYIDKLPAFFKHGIQCPCGARKEKVYESKPKLKEHLKTKVHQKWIDDMNANRSNHYIESTQLKETVKNQQIIIAQLTRQLDAKTKEIELLKSPREPVIDLLTFD
jgi:hypothetical protein